MTSAIYPGQFRLSRVQLYNWGTFCGLHTIDVGRQGFLITGGSGSGKSTLIDAISALLVPGGRVHFNAAAGEAVKSGRNLLTYCRGAWRREHDSEYNELRASFMRNGATWSGINLVYSNGTEELSALRLMHLSASCMNPTDITSIFMTLPRRADLQEFNELAKGGLDLRLAKKQWPDASSVQRTAPPFLSAFRKAVGIADKQALALLHRAQSAKSLADLNTLMRDFMLPEPDTLATANRTVEEFSELSKAYESVDTARKQVDVLSPIKQAADQLDALSTEQSQKAEDRANIDAYAMGFRLEQEKEKLSTYHAQLEEIKAEHAGLVMKKDTLRNDLEQVSLAISGREEAGLIAARGALKLATRDLDETARKQKDFHTQLNKIGAILPHDEESFVDLRVQLEDLIKDAGEKTAKQSERRQTLYSTKDKSEGEIRRLSAELESALKFGSSMDRGLLEARLRISQLTGIDTASLPFVADLISIDPTHRQWQPAAERVMGGFARTLLVADEYYERVSDAINATHLGLKLQYNRLSVADENKRPKAFTPNTLATKIQVKDDRFFSWIQSQLESRFSYVCASSVEEMRTHSRAVTIDGQVKHDHVRHEKDDRRALSDRSRWVLSGNNDDRVEALRAQLNTLRGDMQKAQADIDAFEEQARADSATVTTAQRILECESYDKIDVVRAQQHQQQCQDAVDKLEKGDTQLTQWRAQKSKLSVAFKELEDKIDNTNKEIGSKENQISEAKSTCEYLEESLKDSPDISPASFKRLEAAFSTHAKRSVRADNFAFIQAQVTKDLDTSITQLQKKQEQVRAKAVQKMNEFLGTWPERRGDMEPSYDYCGDFLKLLEHLETDDLPRFVKNFREMLRKQTSQNLNNLLLQIERAASDIRRKIDSDINPPLKVAEFDKGTFLQIEVRDALPAEAKDLKSKLKDIVSGVLNESDGLADEERFLKLKSVIELLEVSDSNPDRVWRKRLDTRQHVAFLGVEKNPDGSSGAVYDSSQGLSGGQAQKLVFFCLAAALRYQLSGAGLGGSKSKACTTQDGFSKFGTVILDEAFDRADAAFTRKAMDVFTEFGFHMVLATPEKMIQTIDRYVDSTVIISCADRQHSTVTPFGDFANENSQ